MSSAVNMTLDDIISKNRQSVTGRAVGGRGIGMRRFRSNGPIRTGNGFSKDTPAGKWQHDKFFDLYGGGNRRGMTPVKRIGTAGRNRIVKMSIYNVPPTVTTADLEELFQGFEVYSVSAHYDEAGNHLGTADLFVDEDSAEAILVEYANIAVDGQQLKFGIVDETGAFGTGRVYGGRIQDRVRRVAPNPIRNRKAITPLARRNNRRENGSVTGVIKPKTKTMTTEELDKELEAYMNSRHPRIA